ncbi:DUF465 domain-containing protein [Candidatus Aminicenantes bacterium AC-708-M15]|jgi:hypothetical protein|nr:DUF465 domain-containing protein [SCandidatus Aminicenantes bacterium Aminicenantia_JdfR_composite]MCP2596368.1 DUF465 domain-containing protein [Candidatus Aminicenantes bacterium AC-335-G13]MCP2604103.1 DUF465 domain-containing protein [Candidatus Aminicenantes bacterium AC-708-M15]MCP2605392.1 DUF465 domain-containing protein [Candidatus Aminicenantes bacterium AC-335-O07]MCP2605997.1 DUF465 domain-containing protein [Candidatus Aminicenantes bacterium AC-708-I09]MCP2617841.1 DUF465 doma
MREEELKKLLLKENEEFKRLYEKHQECEKRLKMLQEKLYLNENEKYEEKILKKEKLALKDKMYHIINEYKKIKNGE